MNQFPFGLKRAILKDSLADLSSQYEPRPKDVQYAMDMIQAYMNLVDNPDLKRTPLRVEDFDALARTMARTLLSTTPTIQDTVVDHLLSALSREDLGMVLRTIKKDPHRLANTRMALIEIGAAYRTLDDLTLWSQIQETLLS